MILIPTPEQFSAAINRPDAFGRWGIAQAAIKRLMADKEFWAEDARVRREYLDAPSELYKFFKSKSSE